MWQADAKKAQKEPDREKEELYRTCFPLYIARSYYNDNHIFQHK